MRIRRHLVPAALLVGAMLSLAPAAASATTTDTTPTNFGRHVRSCVQTMGFSGEHNPGMHRGAAGWDGLACQ